MTHLFLVTVAVPLLFLFIILVSNNMSDDESSIDGSLENFLVREGIRGFTQPQGSTSKHQVVDAGINSDEIGDLSFVSHSSIEDREGDASFSSYGDGDIISGMCLSVRVHYAYSTSRAVFNTH